MDKYDPSRLTEFPKFEPETPQSGVSTFFNKIWKFPLFSPNETIEEPPKPSDNDEQHVQVASEANSKQNDDENNKLEPAYPALPEARSLQNVLRRISSLVAMGSGVSIISCCIT